MIIRSLSLIAALFVSCAAGLLFYRFDHVFFLVLLAGALLVFISSRHPVAYLVLLLIVHESFFKTFDFKLPIWFYSDVTLAMLSVGVLSQSVLRPHRLMTIVREPYFPYLAWIFALVAFSLVWGNFFVFGQPLTEFIPRARPYFLYTVFIYLYLVDFNQGQMKRFMNVCLVAACCVVALLVIDVRVFGGHKIFQLAQWDGIIGSEARSNRITAFMFMSIWVLFYAVSVLRYGHKKGSVRPWMVLVFLAILYDLVFISMGRQAMASVFVTLLLIFVRRPLSVALLLAAVAGVLLFGLIFQMDYKDTFLYGLFDETVREVRDADKGGNVAIRLGGIAHFFQYAEQSYFLGMGIHSSTLASSPVRIGFEKGYNFADLGIFATLYRFGPQAVVFLLFVFARLWRDLRKVIREGSEDERVLAASLLFTLVSMTVLIPSCTAFFKENEVFYYGILLYFANRLAKGLSGGSR